jgi:hypothetical protein
MFHLLLLLKLKILFNFHLFFQTKIAFLERMFHGHFQPYKRGLLALKTWAIRLRQLRLRETKPDLGANLQFGFRKADNGQQVVTVLTKTQERDMGQLCRGFQIGSIRRVWRVL